MANAPKEATMVAIVWIGALLFIGGLLYMARIAIFRGNLSEPHSSAYDPGGLTLEPNRRGLRFLGLAANWPGVLLMVIGALMLLLGAIA
jgi:hypothetical protein